LVDPELTLAGGAILFKEKPAFKEAKVLELARKNCAEKNINLLFASETKEDDNCNDIITCSIPEEKEEKPEKKFSERRNTIVDIKELELSNFSDEELKEFTSLLEANENEEGIEESKRMTYQEQKALPDDMFAVVVTVKNKVTGEPRKIRMFPINDEAHVRNALARLGQPAPQATLKKLGVNIESVRKKILKRAKELKMTQLLERYKSASDLSDIEKSDVKILEQIEAEEKAEAEKKANEEFAKITKDNENLKKEIELSKTEIENLKKVIEAKDAEIKKISEDKVK
jgi:hypothetical protein